MRLHGGSEKHDARSDTGYRSRSCPHALPHVERVLRARAIGSGARLSGQDLHHVVELPVAGVVAQVRDRPREPADGASGARGVPHSDRDVIKGRSRGRARRAHPWGVAEVRGSSRTRVRRTRRCRGGQGAARTRQGRSSAHRRRHERARVPHGPAASDPALPRGVDIAQHARPDQAATARSDLRERVHERVHVLTGAVDAHVRLLPGAARGQVQASSIATSRRTTRPGCPRT